MIMKRFAIVNAGRTNSAFTLIELLISLAVSAMIILMVAQVMNSTTAVTRTGNKHIDTDTQARAVLDRMALDFGKMLKRTDVDYYLKGLASYKGHGKGHGYGQGKAGKDQLGSDQIAFFGQVPGYYPSTGSQSPLSLVAYRVNNDSNSASYLQLERMGKGLLWNGVSTSASKIPIVFLPLTIA